MTGWIDFQKWNFVVKGHNDNPIYNRSQQRSPHYPDIEETQEYWKEEAQNKLFDEINRVDTNKQAKNVILFLGDGMGISTLTAARSDKTS